MHMIISTSALTNNLISFFKLKLTRFVLNGLLHYLSDNVASKINNYIIKTFMISSRQLATILRLEVQNHLQICITNLQNVVAISMCSI